MLKLFFWLLLLANGVLFALYQGYLGDSGERREASRMDSQLHADKIKLLSASSARAAAAPLFASAAPPPAVAPAAAVCVEIGDFSAADGQRFAAQLAALGLRDKAVSQASGDGEVAAGYMVYLPAPANRTALERQLAELQRLEIKEFFVLPAAASLAGAISLGVFKSEEAAKTQLAHLQKKGLHGARLHVRGSAAGRQLFQLRGLESSEQAEFEQLRADFPAQQVRPCGPAEGRTDG